MGFYACDANYRDCLFAQFLCVYCDSKTDLLSTLYTVLWLRVSDG